MKELEITATVENLPKVIKFVEEQIASFGCPLGVRAQIDVAVEEVFVNIAHYAYYPDTGPAVVRVETVKEPLQVILTFLDHGVPFDPLKKNDPNIEQPLNNRDPGGLGIFMVRKIMDAVSYEYRNGQNILTFSKKVKQNK